MFVLSTKYALAIDGYPMKILDFETWKQSLFYLT